MEHTLNGDTRAVLGRFLRRKLRTPLKIAAGGAAAMLLMGAATARHHNTVAVAGAVTEAPAEGVVQSLYVKESGAPYTGTVLALSVRPGQTVRKGQPLFRMDPRGLQTELASAKSDLASAANDLREQQSSYAADLKGTRDSIHALESQMAALRTPPPPQPQPEAQADGDSQDGDSGQYGPPPAPVVDPGQMETLRQQLAEARRDLAARQQQWQPTLRQAEAQVAQAQKRIHHLNALLAMSNATSPADGVVSAVLASAGSGVSQGAPVVRVDNPAGYRVVTQIDKKCRDLVEPGQDIRVQLASGKEVGQVDRIVAGEDKALFTYQLWVKPARAEQLHPGQKLQVFVPRIDQEASAK